MPDPASCPLCEGPNACALAAGSSEPCWCVELSFPPELIERVSTGDENRCICRRCLDRAKAEKTRIPIVEEKNR